jgi:hypothetical protein
MVKCGTALSGRANANSMCESSLIGGTAMLMVTT